MTSNAYNDLYVYYGSRDPFRPSSANSSSSNTVQLYALTSSSPPKLQIVFLKDIKSLFLDQRFIKLRRRLYPGVVFHLPSHLFQRKITSGPHDSILLTLRYVSRSRLKKSLHEAERWGSIMDFDDPRRESLKALIQAKIEHLLASFAEEVSSEPTSTSQLSSHGTSTKSNSKDKI